MEEVHGFGRERSIANVSKDVNSIKELVDMLAMFILQVAMKDGSLYPLTNIQSLIRTIGKLIRQRQGQLVVETGKAPTIPFDNFTDVRYRRVKLAGDEAALRASNVGLGKNIKKLVFCQFRRRERCYWVRPFVSQHHLRPQPSIRLLLYAELFYSGLLIIEEC